MRKVYVDVVVRLVLNMDENISVTEVINEMDYDFTSCTDGADIVDMEIMDHEVTDSK
jgi:hypothetical protein